MPRTMEGGDADAMLDLYVGEGTVTIASENGATLEGADALPRFFRTIGLDPDKILRSQKICSVYKSAARELFFVYDDVLLDTEEMAQLNIALASMCMEPAWR